MLGFTSRPGAAHSDDLCYLFRYFIFLTPSSFLSSRSKNEKNEKNDRRCLEYENILKNLCPFSCNFARQYYNEVNENKNDAQSKITLEAIDVATKLFTNFAKTG